MLAGRVDRRRRHHDGRQQRCARHELEQPRRRAPSDPTMRDVQNRPVVPGSCVIASANTVDVGWFFGKREGGRPWPST